MEQLEVHADDRGRLFKTFEFADSEVFVITIEPGKTRGNHYHRRKIEMFSIVSGSCEIRCRNKKTNETTVYTLDESTPTTLTVTPGNVHNIYSENGCVVIGWVSEPFDPEDTDTYAEDV